MNLEKQVWEVWNVENKLQRKGQKLSLSFKLRMLHFKHKMTTKTNANIHNKNFQEICTKQKVQGQVHLETIMFELEIREHKNNINHKQMQTSNGHNWSRNFQLTIN